MSLLEQEFKVLKGSRESACQSAGLSPWVWEYIVRVSVQGVTLVTDYSPAMNTLEPPCYVVILWHAGLKVSMLNASASLG